MCSMYCHFRLRAHTFYARAHHASATAISELETNERDDIHVNVKQQTGPQMCIALSPSAVTFSLVVCLFFTLFTFKWYTYTREHSFIHTHTRTLWKTNVEYTVRNLRINWFVMTTLTHVLLYDRHSSSRVTTDSWAIASTKYIEKAHHTNRKKKKREERICVCTINWLAKQRTHRINQCYIVNRRICCCCCSCMQLKISAFGLNVSPGPIYLSSVDTSDKILSISG